MGKFKEDEEYNKPGRDFREVIANYKKYTTQTEFKLFLGIPIIASILVFIYFWFFEKSNSNLLSYIMEMNQNSLTVVAILAGFNTTSLSIIAASNNKVLKFLKQHKLKDSEDTVLKQLVSFFSFAILVQLIVLVIGIMLSMISKSFGDVAVILPILSGLAVKIPLSILGVVWLATILFTIIISIRNATLLYRYVLFIADYEE
ncbi:hypothetical protein ACFPRA_01245 [Sporosarcina soli]|uniref:Uncharacterized protein n=1 Tax=Sporosarcina soli TaxID=334736 RepID=A0ABW0TDX8_9BACL